METYFTKVKVQADRYIVEADRPTIIIENEEADANDGWVKSNDAAGKARYRLDEDCPCG